MANRFTQVVKAAASYDLTTLARAKIELGLEQSDVSKNAYISAAITEVSAAIANYCNRVFPVERISDTFYLLSDDANFNTDSAISPLELSRWPVVAILSLTEDGTALVENTDYLVDYDAGQIFRLNTTLRSLRPWSCAPIIVTYDAGFGVRAVEPGTIPATPYALTAAKTASFFADEGVTFNSDGSALTPVASSPVAGQYTVSSVGLYTFAAADTGKAVTLQYAWNNLPADLAGITRRLITMRYHQKDRDPMLMSRSQPATGEERWWVGGIPGQDGTFPPDIEGQLDQYRMPSVG